MRFLLCFWLAIVQACMVANGVAEARRLNTTCEMHAFGELKRINASANRASQLGNRGLWLWFDPRLDGNVRKRGRIGLNVFVAYHKIVDAWMYPSGVMEISRVGGIKFAQV
jgi:hypothetical protein